ncbi:hypothetical protein [uncultured Tateyamaria sp.]|uniref:hypothetical protein n=1 Tax=uncultured Tateyamaria sp. TaxID=455651 RepID=UPI00262432BD|nr:hypothetical protein [uncultured Tateyamaria sp.]
MSDTPKKVRVVLGPIARKLLEGAEGNKGKALDEAIMGLIEGPASGHPSGPDTQTLCSDIQTLTETVRAQGDLLRLLEKAVILEQRMTRIYIASTLSETDEEQRELLAFAAEAVEQLIDKSDVISERKLEDLKSVEEAAETAMRRELERGVQEELDLSDPELER